MAGTMAAGALMNSSEASRKRKQERAQNQAAAVQTAFSPWTGMGAGEISNNAPGALGAALQGGIQGASMGANLQGAFKSKPTPESFAQAPSNGDGTFGGGDGMMRMSKMNGPTVEEQIANSPQNATSLGARRGGIYSMIG